MVRVEEAEKIILSQAKDYGTEVLHFESALGRVLAEDIKADRDLPPYNRVTMDGIAINYKGFEKGARSFKIKATQAAGEDPVEIEKLDECVEIMTGAALPETTDTVVRYEDLEIKDGTAAIIADTVQKGYNIHYRGRDKRKGDAAASVNQLITPALISMSASVGKTELLVKKLPKVVIISSGDELVSVDETPSAYQVRRSNNYTIKAALQQYALQPGMLHIPDDPEVTRREIGKCMEEFDVIILSGGVSMGKFDYIPQALDELNFEKLFHKVQQRPGKPFWFGKHRHGVLVFAFPGNPVSTFMCLHRYFFPWLEKSLGLPERKKLYAALTQDFEFNPPLQYFLQVELNVNENGQILATPVPGNGSGDFANLLDTDAFLELPPEQDNFAKGEVFRIWKFMMNSKW